MPEIVVREAIDAEDIAAVRQLMTDYGRYLEANPLGQCIQVEGYARELAGLPAPYATLLLALVDGAAAGCVALKPLPRAFVDGERPCELKRLWAGPKFRGLGIGRRLMDEAIAWVKRNDYTAMYLDTVPTAFPQASRIYRAMGFVEVERYNDNPVKNVEFFRLALDGYKGVSSE